MKLKSTVLLATFVVTMGLLLGANAAQAATVNFDPNNPNQVTGIENLDIGGTLYNVAFTTNLTTAAQIYGPFPGTFDATTDLQAVDAAMAVNRALNDTGGTAQTVGAGGSDGVPFYRIGFESEAVGEEIEVVIFWGSLKADGVRGQWQRSREQDADSYNSGVRMWADFTLAGSALDPVTIGGTVTGLEGSGLVLQNNGTDNLPRDSDGPFEFATPLTPGTFYNVTVATNPSNPAQPCRVTNGSGQVPTEDVTDVAVTCVEPVLTDVSKVVAEGDTLPDGTVLTDILLDAGVAINQAGKVAFGGKDDDGTDAAFTQDGLVVKEGDILDDGTFLAKFRGLGGVAINDGQSGDKLAFHGDGEAEEGDNDTDAVFTQDGVVAAVGDTLSSDMTADGTLDQIDDTGKVAINLFDQVAFHGKAEISGEKFRAVITSDGQTTQVAAREGDTLPDNFFLEKIVVSGGVAINFWDEVAFHGTTIVGGVSLKAVFTSDGLVAAVGNILPDVTHLNDIDENGGVAINALGDVAFHGDALFSAVGIDSVKKAVFTQDGLVAKEGDTLPDGTPLDEIEVSGGVAINLFGDVAFHGRTGGVKAVFTQHGLVAKEGENLTDGTTLNEINDSAGVAINTYGLEVAFHGEVDGTHAVFVVQAPVVDFGD